jgi:hypothetical protein
MRNSESGMAAWAESDVQSRGRERRGLGRELETRNNRDFGDALIRAVFDEVSGAI